MQDKRVLVVDDEEFNCLLIEMAFEDTYSVQSVFSGQDCLRASTAYNPDVVLLDINMPGMTGIEVCKQLKSSPETQDIPVIFVSALESQEIKTEAKKAGGIDYFTKPIDPDELVNRVDLIFSEPS